MIKPVAVALLSWMFSLLIAEAYGVQTWVCLLNFAIVDFMFFAIFYQSDMNYQKVRWVCSLLFLSIVASGLSSIAFALFHYKLIGDSFIVDVELDLFGKLSFSISLLIVIVSTLSDRFMDKFDALCWPGFANNFRFHFDLSRIHNAKKGAF